MTNKCSIISQIITFLHVSTLSCHHQGSCNQYLCQVTQVFQMQLLVIQFTIKMYAFFWVIYMATFRNTLFHFHRRIGKIQSPGNYPEESIQH